MLSGVSTVPTTSMGLGRHSRTTRGGGLLCGATNANSRIVFQRDDLECVISEQQLLSEGISEDGIQIEGSSDTWSDTAIVQRI